MNLKLCKYLFTLLKYHSFLRVSPQLSSTTLSGRKCSLLNFLWGKFELALEMGWNRRIATVDIQGGRFPSSKFSVFFSFQLGFHVNLISLNVNRKVSTLEANLVFTTINLVDVKSTIFKILQSNFSKNYKVHFA